MCDGGKVQAEDLGTRWYLKNCPSAISNGLTREHTRGSYVRVLTDDTLCRVPVHIWTYTHPRKCLCACFWHTQAHIGTSTPACTHSRTSSLHKHLHPHAQIKANAEARACQSVHMQVRCEMLAQNPQKLLRGEQSHHVHRAGTAPSIPPESHFLESVSYGGLSESEMGAGPSWGGRTGRRGGCMGKGRHQPSALKRVLGVTGTFSSLQSPGIGQLWFPPERRNSGLPPLPLGF